MGDPEDADDLSTDHYGFVVDYLAEALREMRKHNFTEVIDRHFSMGARRFKSRQPRAQT